MTFEEFKQFYEERGYLPNDISQRKNKLNGKQLERRYNKYIESLQPKVFEVDKEWEGIKEKISIENCTFLKQLEEDKLFEDIQILKKEGGFLLKTIDLAHVFPRSGYPFLKYDEENIVALNRYSHSCLDTMRDPVTGEPITKEQHKLYWIYIVGIERFTRLEEKIKNYGRIGYSYQKTAEKIF